MIEEYQIRILPEQAASEEGIKRYLLTHGHVYNK